MPGTKLTVLVASERAEGRELLTHMVGRDPAAVVVAQTDSGVGALGLARRLRPDIAMVDSELPHLVGLDAVRLSRTGGLDTAMGIVQELPTTTAVLLTDLSQALDLEEAHRGAFELSLFTNAGSVRVTIADLFSRSRTSAPLAFARLRANEREAESRADRLVKMCETTALYGGLGVLAGLGLMLTLIFFAPGAVVALVAIGLLLLSLAARTAMLWTRARRSSVYRPSNQAVERPQEGMRDGAKAGP